MLRWWYLQWRKHSEMEPHQKLPAAVISAVKKSICVIEMSAIPQPTGSECYDIEAYNDSISKSRDKRMEGGRRSPTKKRNHELNSRHRSVVLTNHIKAPTAVHSTLSTRGIQHAFTRSTTPGLPYSSQSNFSIVPFFALLRNF